MLQAIHSVEDYRARVRAFDAVLEHARAVASAVAAVPAGSAHAAYGEQAFLKLLMHCVALRTLAGDPARAAPRALLDVPSLCAVARSAVEAHDAYEYIAGHEMAAEERTFRLQLWELHDLARRLKMTGDLGAADARLSHLPARVELLRARLDADAFMATLQPELQAELRRRFSRGDPPAFHLNQRQRCTLSGVDADWYGDVMLLLSQYAHTLPFSLHQVFESPAGSPEALRLMAMPLVTALPFLVRVTQAVGLRHPGASPEPPSRTARTMATWRAMAETRTPQSGTNIAL
ncbi:MAG: hypothetical protein EOP73_29575 [Variovorax sp.]|nr:MAG: hypothetical protein EOP73_29575 [Variovorax sp.]